MSSRAFKSAAGLALIASIAALWGWLRPEAPREISRFGVVLPDSQGLANAPTSSRVALSPDGRTVVYVGGTLSSGIGTTRLFVRQLDQLDVTPLPGTENAGSPAISPDGKKVAFVGRGSSNALKVMAISGGPAITITDSLVDAGQVTWGRDGYIYYDGHLAGDGVARIRETGGAPEAVSMPDSARGELWHLATDPLPNGRGVLIMIATGVGANARNIGVVDLRTGGHKVLTRGVTARYAPSGHLVYVEDGALMAAPFDAERLEITGEAVALAEGVSMRGSRADVVISQTGHLAYTTGTIVSARRELVWVSRDGRSTAVDPDWSVEINSLPAISPDGRSVAVALGATGQRSIWVKQLDRGPSQQVTPLATAPKWSPDGRQLYFSSGTEIRRVAADGSQPPEPLRSGGTTPEVSRDGKWVVFIRGADLFGFRTEGDTSTVALVTDPDGQFGPAISPDGRWLAYVSQESREPKVFVRPFPDTRSAKHPVSVSGGLHPRWSPSGRELYFIDPASSQLMAATVTPGPRFSASVPTPLFSVAAFAPMALSSFDVHPDGRRFLFSRAVGTQTERSDDLVIVQNFVEELRAKVPR